MTRKVGTESQGTYDDKIASGFFNKYMRGIGLDIGYAGYISGCLPILDTAIGVDVDYLGYENGILPFNNESQDYVFSSHCLEHIEYYHNAIEEWFRVLKVGGFMVIIVPHQYLYEKRYTLPSSWNKDHKRFYTPGSLLNEIEETLMPNSYRVRMLEDGDKGFDYSIPAHMHPGGQYEITLVIEKIKQPNWKLE